MISHYLRIALRNLWKNKGFTFINVTGLAVAMAITLLSMLYVASEVSYDRFHQHLDRIFRLIVNVESAVEGTESSSVMTAGVGPSFYESIPEIEAMVRVSNPERAFIEFNGKNHSIPSLIYADSLFFNVFSFPLIHGNPGTALGEPNVLLVSERLAEKMGIEPSSLPGKMVRLRDAQLLRITGTFKDPPGNSHLKFDAVVSFLTLYENPNMYLGWNGGWNYYTYLLLNPEADRDRVERQFVPIAYENINQEQEDIGVRWDFSLQSLKSAHLDSSLTWDIETRGSRTRLYIFILVTFTILIIACINFINLTTAAALNRMKEVGVRKVSGAGKKQIVFQFLTESLMVSLTALILALVFIEILHQWVSGWITDPVFLEVFELYNRSFIHIGGAVILLILAVGFLAGTYPALFMARFKPALAVKGRVLPDRKSPVIRNFLVVFQFVISIVLILCTVGFASQIRFLLQSDKGFDPQGKLIVPLASETSKSSVAVLKESFLGIPGIEKVGASSQVPGYDFTMNGYFPQGHDKPLMFHALDVDDDYLPSMGLNLVRGRNFSDGYGSDDTAYLVNEALVKLLGWEDPLGKIITRGGKHPVIGVVENFNFSTLHNNIEPLIITRKPWRGYSYLTIQTSGITEELVNRLEKQWKLVVPNETFDAFGLEGYIERAYGTEKEYMLLLLLCAGMTLFIASLGLFGLSAFVTRRRHREIAVRKVFGAGIKRIISHVSFDYLKWVLLANVLAWPIAFYILDRFFLSQFAYARPLPWWIFPSALLFTAGLSLLVIISQVLRLGKLNPADYIRYE
jgi:putative ABC transport system permease protein